MSPEASTVQLNGLPAVIPLLWQVTVTINGVTWRETTADPEAVTALASETLNDSVLDPFTDSTRLKLPVPLYGTVPPVAETSHENATPTLAVVGQTTDTISGWATTITVAVAVVLAPLASVTVKESVRLPFVASVRLIDPAPV